MLLKSDGILVKFPFFQGNVGKFFVSVKQKKKKEEKIV